MKISLIILSEMFQSFLKCVILKNFCVPFKLPDLNVNHLPPFATLKITSHKIFILHSQTFDARQASNFKGPQHSSPHFCWHLQVARLPRLPPVDIAYMHCLDSLHLMNEVRTYICKSQLVYRQRFLIFYYYYFYQKMLYSAVTILQFAKRMSTLQGSFLARYLKMSRVTRGIISPLQNHQMYYTAEK